MCEFFSKRLGKACAKPKVVSTFEGKKFCKVHSKFGYALLKTNIVKPKVQAVRKRQKKVLPTLPEVVVLDEKADPLINPRVNAVVKTLNEININKILANTDTQANTSDMSSDLTKVSDEQRPVANEYTTKMCVRGLCMLEDLLGGLMTKYLGGVSISGTMQVYQSFDPEFKLISSMDVAKMIDIDESRPAASFLKILLFSMVLTLVNSGANRLCNNTIAIPQQPITQPVVDRSASEATLDEQLKKFKEENKLVE